MRKIKILMVAVLACCAMSVSAQDNFKQAVEKYLSVTGNTVAKEKIVESVKEVCQKIGKNESEGKDFVEKEVYPQIIKTMTEEFQKLCTIEDLKAIIADFETPEGKKATKGFESLSSQENMQQAMMLLQPAIMSIMQGQSAQPVQAPQVTGSYKEKFHALYQTAEIGSSLTQILDIVKSMAGDDPRTQTLVSSLNMYLTFNSENIMLSVAKNTMTEADLDFLNKTYSTPSGQKVIKATIAASKTLAPILMLSMKKFTGVK